jgi:predicted nucleotidyltransferase
LETLKPPLKEKHQVKTIGIFDSHTRSKQTQKSDITIIIEFAENAHTGFFKFLKLEEYLTKKLQIKVDLATKNALKPTIKEQILKKTIHA